MTNMMDKTDCRSEQRSCWAFWVVSVSKLCINATPAELGVILSGDRITQRQLESENSEYLHSESFCLALCWSNWLIQKPKYLQHLLSKPCLGLGATNVIFAFQTYWYFTSTCPHCDLLVEEFYCFNVEKFSYFLLPFLLHRCIFCEVTIHTPDWNEMRLQYILRTVMKNL